MDIGRNFTFVTEDEAWIKKVLIGGASMLLMGLPFLGYAKQMFKNVQAGEERPLPEWDNFVGYLVEGVKAVVVGIVWAVPAVVCIMGAVAAFVLSGKIAAFRFAGFGCMCLAIPLYLLSMVAAPAGIMRFFVTDSIGEGLNFREVLGFIKANVGQYLLALVIAAVAGAAGGLGVIACFVGVLFTAPYAHLVGWKCLADMYRDAQAQAA